MFFGRTQAKRKIHDDLKFLVTRPSTTLTLSRSFFGRTKKDIHAT
jgi:hypothetical protein